MRILVLGGYGFIGEAVMTALHRAGHDLTGLGRDIARAERRMPFARWVKADLRALQIIESWQPLLEDIDAVVNAAGALQDNPRDDLAAVQAGAMQALYAAASAGAQPLIVQISANTAGAGADTPFMATKRTADEALKASGLPHVILRPALVVGRNAHGGTALVRALAAFPWVTPLVHPDAHVETVVLDDAASAVVAAVDGAYATGSDLDLAHAETWTLERLVARHRAWLGLKPARTMEVPTWLAALAARAADLAGWFGWRSPLRSTAMTVTAGGISTSTHESSNEAGESPSQPIAGKLLASLDEVLSANPAGAQDVWFARLYLLKPVIVLALALFWITSGAVALFHLTASTAYLSAAGFGGVTAIAVAWITSLADLALGLAVLWRRLARPALLGMIALSLAYLVSVTWFSVSLWLDPLGPIVKVLPSILLTMVALAILDER